MKNIKNYYNNELNKYSISDSISDQILCNIKKNYKIHKRKKTIIFSVISAFMIVLIGLGSAYAKNIEKLINDLKIRYIDKGEFKTVHIETYPIKDFNVDSKIKEHFIYTDSLVDNLYEKDNNYLTLDEIKQELNVKLLRNSKIGVTKLYPISVKRKDNQIVSISFAIPQIDLIKPTKVDKKGRNYSYDNGMARISYGVGLRSKKFEYDEVYKQFAHGYIDNYHSAEEYYIKNLDAKVIIFIEDYLSFGFYRVEFVVDDVVYYINVEYNNIFKENNPRYIYELLDSFSY